MNLGTKEGDKKGSSRGSMGPRQPLRVWDLSLCAVSAINDICGKVGTSQILETHHVEVNLTSFDENLSSLLVHNCHLMTR